MFDNKIPLSPLEAKDVQDNALDQLFGINEKLHEVILSERTLGPEGLSAYKWGLVSTLIENMKETYSQADWKIKTGRIKHGGGTTNATPDKGTQ